MQRRNRTGSYVHGSILSKILNQSPTPWSHPNWTWRVSGMKVVIEWQALCFRDIIMHYECTYTMSRMPTFCPSVTLLKMWNPLWYFVIIKSGWIYQQDIYHHIDTRLIRCSCVFDFPCKVIRNTDMFCWKNPQNYEFHMLIYRELECYVLSIA